MNLIGPSLDLLDKLLIKQTETSFFRTSNGLEHVHLFVIELDQPIFAFERLYIDPSLLLEREAYLAFMNYVVVSFFFKVAGTIFCP